MHTPFIVQFIFAILIILSICREGECQTTDTSDNSTVWEPPSITLNSEIVVECPIRNSGFYVTYHGYDKNANDNGKHCYHYQVNRFGELWNCDDTAIQTFSYLIMDACPNTTNGDFSTLIKMQRAMAGDNYENYKANPDIDGTLGAFYDRDWEVEGYLIENFELDTKIKHIKVKICLDEIYPVIDQGEWCFYSFYNPDSEKIDTERVLPSGRVLNRPRRGRLDILSHLEDNRRRRRLEELNELKNNLNEDYIMTQDEKYELIELENEELRLKKLKEETKMKRNGIKHSHSHRRRLNSNTQVNGEAAGSGSGSGTDTYDTFDTSDGEISFNAGEAEGNGNGVTYFVCATDRVSVPNVCAEYD